MKSAGVASVTAHMRAQPNCGSVMFGPSLRLVTTATSARESTLVQVTMSALAGVLAQADDANYVCSADRPTVADVPITIDRMSEVPTYRQLADELRQLIRTGQLKSGDQLPSIHELMTETGLAQNTIRSAVAVLREEGLVVTAPGRGVFVK
jgi:DNA-binding transcriptional ArsR family regulator